MKEQFEDMVTDLKALQKASPWAAAQIGKKAMVKAAKCMAEMIAVIEAQQKRIEELERGSRGES